VNDPPLPGALVESQLGARTKLTRPGLSNLDLIIAIVVAFAVGFGGGYATRERKSRMRRRHYYQQ
jgi:hypothetical protein